MVSKSFRINAGLVALLLIATTLYARHQIQSHKKVNEHAAWQYDRSWELRSEHTSWLNLAGLYWLEEGTSTFGYGASNDFQLKEGDGPDYLGSFVREGDSVYFDPNARLDLKPKDSAPRERILMKSDAGESDPTVLVHDNLKWWVIARDGKLGVRVRDIKSAKWKAFDGIDSYDFDPEWQLSAQFVPYEEPQEFTYPTVIGTDRSEKSPGLLVFEYKDKQYEMIPFERNEGARFFLVFADQTSGETTYGGGRFLYVEKPDESGNTIIDFNKAYNPPCSFSEYSTCPQPLPQNRLPFEVLAGEKVYKK